MPPLSALEDELRLGVGGKREKRWSRGRGRGRSLLPATWPLGFLASPSSELLPDVQDLSLLSPLPSPPAALGGDRRPLRRVISLCTCRAVTLDSLPLLLSLGARTHTHTHTYSEYPKLVNSTTETHLLNPLSPLPPLCYGHCVGPVTFCLELCSSLLVGLSASTLAFAHTISQTATGNWRDVCKMYR